MPKKLSDYQKLQNAVAAVLSTLTWEADYHYQQQYGGRYDESERTCVVFNTGTRLRTLGKTHKQLLKAQNALSYNGGFSTRLHLTRGGLDYVLIVQFGPKRIVL